MATPRQILKRRQNQFPIVGISTPILCLLPLLSSIPAHAQTTYLERSIPSAERKIRLSPDELLQFTKAPTSLSKQSGVPIVVEGVPKHSTLALQDAASLSAHPTFGETLTKVALSYGYTVHAYHNIPGIVLQKNFIYRRDIPEMPLSECSAALTDIATTLETLNPGVTRVNHSLGGPLVIDFIKTLSSDQMQSLQNQTLTVSSLRQEQQALVKRTALFVYVQCSLEDVAQARSILKAIGNANLKINASGDFGYEYVDETHHTKFINLDKEQQGLIPPAKATKVVDDIKALTTQALTTEQLSSSKSVQTLKQVIDKLNASISKPGKHYSVSTDVASKRVMLFGEESMDADATVATLASACGLRRYTLPSDNTHPDNIDILDRPHTRSSISPEDISRFIQEALPATLVNYIDESAHQRPPRAPNIPPTMSQSQQSEIMHQHKEAVKKYLSNPDNRFTRMGALEFEAIQELREYFINKAKKEKLTSLSVDKLPLDQDRELAAIVMAPLVQVLTKSWLRPAPAYITNFPETYVTGGPYTSPAGKPKIGLFLSVKDPAGHIRNLAGVMDFDYPQQTVSHP